jgi:hypothetical protein
MLAGTHILSGIAIWEFSPGPWWARIPLAAVGGYVSHYLLDSAASYHQSWPDSWGDVGLLWVQMACVSVVIGVLAYREWERRANDAKGNAHAGRVAKDRGFPARVSRTE